MTFFLPPFFLGAREFAEEVQQPRARRDPASGGQGSAQGYQDPDPPRLLRQGRDLLPAAQLRDGRGTEVNVPYLRGHALRINNEIKAKRK